MTDSIRRGFALSANSCRSSKRTQTVVTKSKRRSPPLALFSVASAYIALRLVLFIHICTYILLQRCPPITATNRSAGLDFPGQTVTPLLPTVPTLLPFLPLCPLESEIDVMIMVMIAVKTPTATVHILTEDSSDAQFGASYAALGRSSSSSSAGGPRPTKRRRQTGPDLVAFDKPFPCAFRPCHYRATYTYHHGVPVPL